MPTVKCIRHKTIALSRTKSFLYIEYMCNICALNFDAHDIDLPYDSDMIAATECKLCRTLNCIEEFISDGPRSLSIVEYGDRLECSAHGNPTPVYRWTNVETNRSTDGSVYKLNRTNDNEHTFQCTATNTFAAESKTYTIKG